LAAKLAKQNIQETDFQRISFGSAASVLSLFSMFQEEEAGRISASFLNRKEAER
jgi:hypothetical protein